MFKMLQVEKNKCYHCTGPKTKLSTKIIILLAASSNPSPSSLCVLLPVTPSHNLVHAAPCKPPPSSQCVLPPATLTLIPMRAVSYKPPPTLSLCMLLPATPTLIPVCAASYKPPTLQPSNPPLPEKTIQCAVRKHQMHMWSDPGVTLLGIYPTATLKMSAIIQCNNVTAKDYKYSNTTGIICRCKKE